jgi:hypothetical protein
MIFQRIEDRSNIQLTLGKLKCANSVTMFMGAKILTAIEAQNH